MNPRYKKKAPRRPRKARKAGVRKAGVRKARRAGVRPARRGLRLATALRLRSTAACMTQSTWRMSHKPTPQVTAIERVGAPNVYVTNGITGVYASTNRYGMNWLAYTSNPQLYKLFTLIPSQRGNRRLVLESVQALNSIANGTNAPVEMELYDIILKRDLPRTNVITSGGNPWTCTSDPVSYVLNGIAAAQSTGATPVSTFAQTNLPIGLSVYDSPFFNQYFKVSKRTIVELMPGATHQHAVYLTTNKLLDESAVSPTNPALSNEGTADSKDLATFTLIMLRPQPAIDISGSTPILCSAGGNLNVVQSIRYKYTFTQDISQANYYINSLPAVNPADVTQIVSPTSGLVTAVAAA